MTTRIQLVVPDDWVDQIDAWRRQQPKIPSRSEAIRQLVEKGIKADDKKR